MDRAAEAEKELREEIRLHPDQVDARAGLSLVYAALGRMEDAREVIDEMIRQVGTAEAYVRGVRALAFYRDRAASEALRREGERRFPAEARLRKPA